MEIQVIQNKILEIRGFRVIADYDLAELYEVETKRLKEAVRRNINRFPSPDFMFELTKEEYQFLRTQIATLENGKGRYSKYTAFVFTELGVAMLSSVLNSDKAIQVNISIMKAFVMLREITSGYAELKRQLEEYQLNTTLQIAEILDLINELAQKQQIIDQPRKRITGFKKII